MGSQRPVFAEEAFTVYDHPKVLIFQKQPDFSAAQVQNLLGAVDLSHVVHLTPKQAGTYKSLMLPAAALGEQQAGGPGQSCSTMTGFKIVIRFSPDYLVSIYFVLGVLTYPIIRFALPGLGDKGYPLARVLGLVLLGLLSWLSGSLGIPATRTAIALIFAALMYQACTLVASQR